MARRDRLQLGIDVGGTFTDIVLLNVSTGEIATEKTLTTPADPSVGITDGVQQLKHRGANLAQIATVIHGTTLVSNALIERRGAKVGLLTTKGFRDILHFVGRELRYDIYDPTLIFPEPLVPRHLRLEITERVAGDGQVTAALDQEQARLVIREVLTAGAESMAVCLLHSYLNPKHEQILADIIRHEAGDMPVSLSHEVLPQIREYDRCSATAINAYVQPIVQGYLRQLNNSLAAEGVTGELYLMTSSGGAITAETAARFPIQLVESGPAAGTLIAAHIGKEMGVGGLLSFDMGGTTAKSCVIKEGRPLLSKSYEVARARRFKKGSGLPVGVPVIDLLEIGAGGGSIAELDNLGILRVGPRSAGADPGPVCYRRGGHEPTVTDANVVLGLINPEYFLGGEITLDADAAARAIREKVGRPLGLDAQQAAAAINRVVTETMTEAARVHSVEMNVDIRRLTLVAFGGAGPIHAHGLAHRLRLPKVICPPDAGVLSAVGLLVAPLAFEYSRSHPQNLDELRADAVNQMLDSLEEQGRALLNQAGAAEMTFERSVDMCYVGQGFEVTTPVPFTRADDGDISHLKEMFDDTYEDAYGRRLADLPARCVTWRVLASAPAPQFSLQPHPSDTGPSSPLKGQRVVYFPDHGPAESLLYERSRLVPATVFDGPALIEDRASTIAVPPGMVAMIDESLNVILTHGAPD